MRYKLQNDCSFPGHPFGEYSALADVLPVSSLVDLVFYRGIIMQRAVKCASENRLNYMMCAVGFSRNSKIFTDAALREVIDSIAYRNLV
jgi:fatty acid synthase subunit alpha, fungi type